MTGWIASKICSKIILERLGDYKLETRHKAWGIMWLVGIYCKSDGPR